MSKILQKTKVALVDDHTLVIKGLAALLEEGCDCTVSGLYTTIDQTMAGVKIAQPEVILIDITLGTESGIHLGEQLIARYPLIKLVALTMHENALIMRQAFQAGFSGYLLKNASLSTVCQAIKSVLQSQIFIDPNLVELYKGLAQAENDQAVVNLSAREMEILKLMCAGTTTNEIGSLLHLSPLTISTHRKNIMRKTEQKTLAGLIHLSREKGWI